LGGIGPAVRRIEMEMRIVVPEAAGTSTLAERLSAVFGMERISLLDDRGQVGVRVEGASDRAVLRVIDTVERWLEERAAGSVEMWLGEHSYRIARSAPVETWQ
jgi:hypothetical protein